MPRAHSPTYNVTLYPYLALKLSNPVKLFMIAFY